jgi:hypothetical protein
MHGMTNVLLFNRKPKTTHVFSEEAMMPIRTPSARVGDRLINVSSLFESIRRISNGFEAPPRATCVHM